MEIHAVHVVYRGAGRGGDLNVSVPCVERLLETVPVHAGNARQVGDPTPPVLRILGELYIMESVIVSVVIADDYSFKPAAISVVLAVQEPSVN